MSHPNSKYFFTVGQLRKAIEHLPEDMLVCPQVVATNGNAWNLFSQITDLEQIVVITLSHPKLENLPETAFKSQKT